jgi:predicted nucleic acid-binding Zn ribbon protein
MIQYTKKTKPPKLLSEFLPDLLDELNLSDKIIEQKAILLWSRVVGKEVKKHTKPYTIENGILVVLVDNSAWMSELTFLRTEIIKKLNELISASSANQAASKENKEKKSPEGEIKPIVKDIRFRLMSRP